MVGKHSWILVDLTGVLLFISWHQSNLKQIMSLNLKLEVPHGRSSGTLYSIRELLFFITVAKNKVML